MSRTRIAKGIHQGLCPHCSHNLYVPRDGGGKVYCSNSACPNHKSAVKLTARVSG